MKTKRLTQMLMIRLTVPERERLRKVSEETVLNAAELARMSLREALPLLRRRLPVVEAPHE